MSIFDQGRGAPGQPPTAESDPFGTALVSRLANEFFKESQTHAISGGPSVPSGFSGAPGVPFGSPSTSPGLNGREPNNELAGGFPTAAPQEHPPVHPVLEAEPRTSSVAQRVETPSGAHDPGCRDSHAFGEPRGDGSGFKDPGVESGSGRAKPSITLPASLSSTHASPGAFGEGVSSPHFYFLREEPSRAKTISGPALSSLEVETIRRDFPALHQRVNGRPLVWLDNAATTHKPQSVIDATSRFYGRDNSNIHRAAHTLAERSTELFEAGREKVRQFLGAADVKEIVFGRGTTELINLVAQSYGRKNIGAGDEIILTELEHHANIVPWQLLAEQTGAVLRVVPINNRGELILEEFVRLLGARTKFVSVAHVSNALGTINPVEEIIALAHARRVPVLVDGAQSTPHLPVNVQALNADFYAFSGHKVFGPTGIGALYGKASLLETMPPWQGGGHMIQDVRFEKTIYKQAPERFEAGTPDIAGVVGLGAAIDYLLRLGLPALAAYEHALLEYATGRLATVPGLRPIGTAANKASVLSFVIPGESNEGIAKHLDRHGIAVRGGHHCAQPALRRFGLETTVRPSLAFYNTFAEIDVLVDALHQFPSREPRLKLA